MKKETFGKHLKNVITIDMTPAEVLEALEKHENAKKLRKEFRKEVQKERYKR